MVIQASIYSYTITFISTGIRENLHAFEDHDVIDAAEMPGDLVSLYEVEERLINILRNFSDVQETVELGNRWLGGKILLQPADKNLKGKEFGRLPASDWTTLSITSSLPTHKKPYATRGLRILSLAQRTVK